MGHSTSNPQPGSLRLPRSGGSPFVYSLRTCHTNCASSLLLRLLLLAVCLFQLGASGSDRTVFPGGPILTIDGDNRRVEALGIACDCMAMVGDSSAVQAKPGSRAKVVDLGERTLLPGFIDAPGHLPREGGWQWTCSAPLRRKTRTQLQRHRHAAQFCLTPLL